MSENKNPEARTPYTVDLEEPVAFEADDAGKYMSSLEFCKLVNEYFHLCFADYYGSKFVMNQGFPTITLHFIHKDDANPGEHLATSRKSAKEVNNDLIARTRQRDITLREGDRYWLTEDGIDVIKPLLTSAKYNGGKPDWSSIVSETAYRNNWNMAQPALQLTSVSGIDPRNLCAKLFGYKDEETGSIVDYGVMVLKDMSAPTSIPGVARDPIYAIRINKAYTDVLKKTYEKFGFDTGSGIIR